MIVGWSTANRPLMLTPSPSMIIQLPHGLGWVRKSGARAEKESGLIVHCYTTTQTSPTGRGLVDPVSSRIGSQISAP